MQRKQLLKGKIYRAGRTLVKVVDTTYSPIQSEVYDLIQQTWTPDTTQPRDIDEAFTPEGHSAVRLRGFSEAINAAARRRYLLEVVRATNEKFGTHVHIQAASRDSRIDLTVTGEDNSTVTITAEDYGVLAEAGQEAPAGAKVTLKAIDFARWALGLGVQPNDVADIQPLPGVNPDDLDADLIRRVDAAVELLRSRISRASTIQSEEQDKAAQAEKERRIAGGEDSKRLYISPYKFRDDPAVLAAVETRLAAEGLTDVKVYEGSTFRVNELTLADLRERGLI